jgi:hypothetical protein
VAVDKMRKLNKQKIHNLVLLNNIILCHPTELCEQKVNICSVYSLRLLYIGDQNFTKERKKKRKKKKKRRIILYRRQKTLKKKKKKK